MGTLFAGQEDCDFQSYGSGLSVDTTAGRFRSGYARCSLRNTNAPTSFYRAVNVFSSSSFWFTARIWANSGGGGVSDGPLLRFTDSAGLPRLQIRNTSGGFPPGVLGPYVVEKLDATGAATQLGASFSPPIQDSALFKLDVQVVYSTSGSITIYESNAAGFTPQSVFTYSGDTTTNSLTALNGFDLGDACSGGTSGTNWSEVIVNTQSTLAMCLAYGAPVANGATNTFTSNAASNVNTTTMSLASPDYSTTAAQIDQYTVNAIPAGNFTVRSVVVSGTAGMGTSGPAHLEWGLGLSGVNYWGASVALAANSAPMPSQAIWDTNPATSSPWLTSQVGSAAGFNIGVQSLT